MRFWKTKQKAAIPEVPDDLQQRRDAIHQSALALEEARAVKPEIDRVTDSIRQHNSTNHYIERLQIAYGKG